MFYNLILILLFFLLPNAAFSEDADQLEKLFELKEEPKSSIDSVLPELTDRITSDEQLREPFEPKTIEVLGSTVYTDNDLEPLYTPYLHRTATREHLRDLTEKIIGKYETDGYPYTQVTVEPSDTSTVEPSDTSDGTMRIIIREAYIDNIVIQGEVKDEKGRFARLIEQIKTMRPIYKPDFERYLLLANDLAGVYKVKAKIQASEKDSGAYTLILQFMPWKTALGFVSLNNRGKEGVGPVIVVPGVIVSNPLGYFGKSTIMAASTPKTKELHFVSAEHELPLNDKGTKLKLKASYTISYPSTAAAKAMDVNSRSLTLSFGIDHSFIRTQRKNFTGYGKLDVKYADRRMRLFEKFSEDKMRILRVGGDFDYADSTNAITRLQLKWSRGLSGLGSGSVHNPWVANNNDGIVDFNKVTYSLSRTQPLEFISPKLEKWSAYGAIEGQISADPLLSGEECTVGGRYFGRAYDSSEIAGENCISASIELRRDIGASPIEWLPASLGYLFYDIGKAEQKGNPINQTDRSLSSLGIGLTFQIPPHVSVSMEVAKPLTKEVTDEGNRNLRAFASILALF